MNFVYINAQQEIKPHSVTDLIDTGDYIKAFSEDKGRVITFRKDRIIQEFDTFEQAEEFAKNIPEETALVFKEKVKFQYKKIRQERKPLPLTFCFTGFKKAQKEQLKQLAEEHELRTVQGMSSVVNFLVVCENSKTVGPTKLAKAKEHNIQVIFEDEFYYMLETGIVPEKDENII